MAAPLVVVVAGGDPPPPWVAELAPGGPAVVVAADGGADHALALGWPVHVVVGDLDSIAPATLAALEGAGVEVDRHPTDKDRSDLELAIDRAVALGAGRVVVVGGHGGRLDHLLANAALLASPAWSGVEVAGLLGEARVDVVRAALAWEARAGDVVTLLATHGPARGVRTEGLRFPLRGEDLLPGSTRGLSNEAVGGPAAVSLGEGALLVLSPARPRPGELAPPGGAG